MGHHRAGQQQQRAAQPTLRLELLLQADRQDLHLDAARPQLGQPELREVVAVAAAVEVVDEQDEVVVAVGHDGVAVQGQGVEVGHAAILPHGGGPAG